VITRRGWWLVLEPALLAFTVVVCGGVSLVASSHASALDREDPRDTPGSNRWTTAAPPSVDDGDDDGDDDDDTGVALLGSSIVLTSDDGHDGPLVQTAVPLSLRSARLSSRGPPRGPHDRDLSSWTSGDHDSVDDGDDDDDDDDDGGAALLAASITPTSDEGHDGPRVQTHVPSSLKSERLSSRGPPRSSPDRDLSSWTRGDSERDRHNSPDDDIDDDDDDDDDDDSSELVRSSRASNRGQTWILILSELAGPFSLASRPASVTSNTFPQPGAASRS
jgi:hypothetical protein